jgi:pyruvate dehydrogenase E1 component alpha subunit
LQRLGVSDAELDGVDKEALAAVDLATEGAVAGALPSPDSAFTQVWADGGWSWRN